MKQVLFFLLLLIGGPVWAQNQTQTITGTITDEASHTPLIGATISLVSNPATGTVTDADGHFRLAGVPIGRQSIRVSFLGYEERIIPDIVVTAGKEDPNF